MPGDGAARGRAGTVEGRGRRHKAEKNDTPKGGLLGDFSVSQIIATGLAAATSFALSAQIGIAGSIIGAVLISLYSSVATQVYRTILQSCAE